MYTANGKTAGVDIVKYRIKHHKFCFIGAFNKLMMNKEEVVMREVSKRLLPVIKQRGYRCRPPEVSMEDYKFYLKLMNEYAIRVVA